MNAVVLVLVGARGRVDSPFVSRLLAQDARSRGGDQGGSSAHSSLGVRLHHGGHRLRGAERAGDGAGDETLGQNHACATRGSKKVVRN